MPDPRIHRCKQDDNLSKIAAEYPEIDRSVIEEAIQKLGRDNPYLLCEGDVLELPFVEDKKDSKAQDASHPYGAQGPKANLNLRILDEDRKTPVADAPFTLAIEGETKPREGTTDADGRLAVEDIPATASTAELTVRIPAWEKVGADPPELKWSLSLGGLNPILDKDLPDDDPRLVMAVQQRLANFAYYRGAIDGVVNPATRRAIGAFRKAFGLAEGEAVDDSVRRKLAEMHEKTA